MTDRKNRSKSRNLREETAKPETPKPKQPIGIDNRGESTRRYGGLEPEGYTRHFHGNREGEFQSGGKQQPELPIEESSPMKEARFRKDKDQRAVPSDQFGGRTFDDLPGDHDIADNLLKRPPPQGS